MPLSTGIIEGQKAVLQDEASAGASKQALKRRHVVLSDSDND